MKTTDFQYETLGTLGNEYSCSCIVANTLKKARQIILFPTFEDASVAVKEQKIEAFLVPGAYQKIGNFIMDKLLRVQDVDIAKIPSIVLAGKHLYKPEGVRKLYIHPAVMRLLPEAGMRYADIIQVDSNPQASEYVNKYPEGTIAITNEPSAKHYNLNIYEVLRDSIFMPFILFVKN